VLEGGQKATGSVDKWSRSLAPPVLLHLQLHVCVVCSVSIYATKSLAVAPALNMLVLAGAGCGDHRCCSSHITPANLCAQFHVSPHTITKRTHSHTHTPTLFCYCTRHHVVVQGVPVHPPPPPPPPPPPSFSTSLPLFFFFRGAPFTPPPPPTHTHTPLRSVMSLPIL